MANIYQWFSQHIDYMFFVYGLSEVIMSIAILIMPKRESQFHLKKILWMLAVFALLHSVGDFTSIISVVKEETKQDIGLLFTSVSYLFLFEFGRRLMNLSKKTLPWWLLPVGVALTLSCSLLLSNFLTGISIFFGYFIRFPAGIMASIGFLHYYNFIKSDVGNKKIKSYFFIASIAMFFWAIFCGIVRIEGDFFPANIINTTTFFEYIGLHIQVFRTLASLFTTVALFGILDIFKWEMIYKLQAHHIKLENIVEQRTEELRNINIKLENDIEKRKQIENELLQSELKFRSVLQSAQDAIILADENENIIFWNQSSEKLFGYNASEVIGKSLDIIIPEHLKVAHKEGFRKHVATGQSNVIGKVVELVGLRKDTSEFPIELSLSYWITDNRKSYCGIIRDITERKKIEEKLIRANKDVKILNQTLIAKNKDVEQYSYIISHDLQEPLRSINNFIDLIEKEFVGKMDEDLKQYLEFITQSANRMRTLIINVLDYSRLGKNNQLARTDCNTIVNDVLIDLTATVQKSQAKIKFDNLPVTNAFPIELKQLFQNLIVNAIKFRKKDIPPEIIITAKKENDTWLFAVQDNGIGINEKHKEKIFEIFQRLHNRDEYEGTGIGLAFCKKIVEMHEGTIWIASKEGEGSTFFFSISDSLN